MKKIYKILLTALFLRLIFIFVTWHPDLNSNADWGTRFWQYGPEVFYKANVWNFTWPNQPPGTIYIYAAVRKLFEFTFAFFWMLNLKIPAFPSNIISFFELNLYQGMLKLPAIFCDLGIAYLIYKLLDKKEKIALVGAIVYLANPVVWYNSTIWGQTDSIINLLALLSVFFLTKKKIIYALIALALSLYIKISLAIFVPIILLFALRQRHSLVSWSIGIIAAIGIFIVPSLPFVQDKNPFIWIYEIYKDKVLGQQLHVITANAFNLWAGLTGIHEQPDTLLFGVMSYRMWGNVLFGLSYIPALYLVFKRQTLNSVAWALSIVAYSSFMLSTNMHERYIYPLFPYLTILLSLHISLLPIYIIVSVISLLGMYNYWWFPKIDIIVEAMSTGNKILPRILGFLNFATFIVFYKSFLQKEIKVSKG